MEETPADILPVLLPIVVVVVVVVGFVAIVFWIGSGKKRSYEEAKALASKKAEEKLKEREKKHASPRAFKGRRNFRKKKSDDAADENPQPAKGILKAGKVAAVSQAPSNVPTAERPKVDFKLNTTPPKVDEVTKDSRVSPPTPYPKESTGTRVSKEDKSPPPILSLNAGETDGLSASVEKGEAKKSVSSATSSSGKGSTPSPKPTGTSQPTKGAVATTTRNASSDKPTGAPKKPKAKSKQPTVAGKTNDLALLMNNLFIFGCADNFTVRLVLILFIFLFWCFCF